MSKNNFEWILLEEGYGQELNELEIVYISCCSTEMRLYSLLIFDYWEGEKK
tara:strand:- start:6999 stop:7151 length:153 start_codon:yes stop_codon:yes gene_type:complete